MKFCGPGVKKSGIDRHSCQQRFIAGCTEEAVRGIRLGGEREKAHNILNVLVPCDCGFDLFLNLFVTRE